MHMTDAFLSPPVGLACAAAAAGLVAWSAREFRDDPLHDRKVPLAGVLGAFVFAAQMVNFSVPLTGSSGHLGGGLLLAVLLGPWAGMLAMAAVLVIQCLFFMDGGLLALGANFINLALWPCLVGAPLYGWLAGAPAGQRPGWRPALAAVLAVAVSLELGAFGVTVETLLSNRTELPFRSFSLLMLAIHLPIAIVEGLVTAGVLRLIAEQRPGVLAGVQPASWGARGRRRLAVALALAALAVGGGLSWMASERPDGLEWAAAKAAQGAPAERNDLPAWFRQGRDWARKLAIFPEYAPRQAEGETPPPVSFQGNAAAGLFGTAAAALAILGLGVLSRRRSGNRHRHSHGHGHLHSRPEPGSTHHHHDGEAGQ